MNFTEWIQVATQIVTAVTAVVMPSWVIKHICSRRNNHQRMNLKGFFVPNTWRGVRQHMKALPGLLIEYLISGLVALIWVYPLIPMEVTTNKSYLIFLPLVYVLGMVVDFVAYWITLGPKIFIREYANKKKGIATTSTSHRKALFYSIQLTCGTR